MTQIYVNARFLAQPQSGVQRFALEITNALGRVWPTASVRAPTLLAPAATREKAEVLPLRKVGRRQGIAWEQIELPRHAADGVLVNLGNTAPLRGGRQLVVIHDAAVYRAPESYSWKFRAWYKLLQRRLVRSGTRIVTVSKASRQDIAHHLGIPCSDIAVISEGADHIRRVPPDGTVLARHGLERGGFVLAVGNLAAHKNLPALGETARTLSRRGLTLVITGGFDSRVFGATREVWPQPAKYIGRVSDAELRALYEAARCFVYPTRYEGFGLTAVEAMACGCPVVASGIPVLREICDGAALFCDPSSPEDIARQIGRVLDEPALAGELVAKGESRAAFLTWERAAGLLADVMLDLADRHPGQRGERGG